MTFLNVLNLFTPRRKKRQMRLASYVTAGAIIQRHAERHKADRSGSLIWVTVSSSAPPPTHLLSHHATGPDLGAEEVSINSTELCKHEKFAAFYKQLPHVEGMGKDTFCKSIMEHNGWYVVGSLLTMFRMQGQQCFPHSFPRNTYYVTANLKGPVHKNNNNHTVPCTNAIFQMSKIPASTTKLNNV